MTRRRRLAALKLVVASALLALTGGPAAAARRPLNGGVIILLVPDYRFELPAAGCAVPTLVLVAEDREVEHIGELLDSEADIEAVHVAETRLDLQLEPLGTGRLAGHSMGPGERQPALVVSRSYAALQHWPPPPPIDRSGCRTPPD